MHAHSHSEPRTASVLSFSLAATMVYIVVLVVAGLRAHSLALISEAGHNLSDFLALLLSWVAVVIANRPANPTKTFGYHRAGVLAAFVNAGSLVVIALFIFYEAFQRFRSPVPVQAGLMMAVAALGLVMNGVIAALLYRSSRDVNIRSAFIHEIGDTLSTAAVILGGLAIMMTGKSWIDPVLSLGIGVLILWSSAGIIRETLNILLEGTPRGVKLEEIAAEMMSREGVCGVHDLHVWSIGSEMHALSCHIRIADIPPSESDRILRDVNECLLRRFQIHHTTVQFEHAPCDVAEDCLRSVAGVHAHQGHSH